MLVGAGEIDACSSWLPPTTGRGADPRAPRAARRARARPCGRRGHEVRPRPRRSARAVANQVRARGRSDDARGGAGPGGVRDDRGRARRAARGPRQVRDRARRDGAGDPGQPGWRWTACSASGAGDRRHGDASGRPARTQRGPPAGARRVAAGRASCRCAGTRWSAAAPAGGSREPRRRGPRVSRAGKLLTTTRQSSRRQAARCHPTVAPSRGRRRHHGRCARGWNPGPVSPRHRAVRGLIGADAATWRASLAASGPRSSGWRSRGGRPRRPVRAPAAVPRVPWQAGESWMPGRRPAPRGAASPQPTSRPSPRPARRLAGPGAVGAARGAPAGPGCSGAPPGAAGPEASSISRRWRQRRRRGARSRAAPAGRAPRRAPLPGAGSSAGAPRFDRRRDQAAGVLLEPAVENGRLARTGEYPLPDRRVGPAGGPGRDGSPGAGARRACASRTGGGGPPRRLSPGSRPRPRVGGTDRARGPRPRLVGRVLCGAPGDGLASRPRRARHPGRAARRDRHKPEIRDGTPGGPGAARNPGSHPRRPRAGATRAPSGGP